MKATIGSSRIPVFVAALVILLGIGYKRASATTRSDDHQSHNLVAQDSITQVFQESRASIADVAKLGKQNRFLENEAKKDAGAGTKLGEKAGRVAGLWKQVQEIEATSTAPVHLGHADDNDEYETKYNQNAINYGLSREVPGDFAVTDEGNIVAFPVITSRSETNVERQASVETSTCSSSLECDKLDYLCVPQKGKSYSKCKKGKEFSKRCKSDQQCYSKSCDAITRKCVCPTAESCVGCNSKRGAPCLRVENLSPKVMDICSLETFQVELNSGKSGKSSSISLFDVGGAHSASYENLNKVTSPSGDKCFSIQSFSTDSHNLLYPPGFLQSSMKMEQLELEEFYGMVVLKGLVRSIKNLVGLQIFMNEYWITHIEESDVMIPNSKETKKKDDLWEIKKYVYPRVSISWEEMRNIVGTGRGDKKMLIVEVVGSRSLDFDIPVGMGIEFVGKGVEESTISIVGSLNIGGRASFLNMTVTFQDGSLHINGPTFFKFSRLLNLNRCPYSFIEYDGLCFLVSDFIEQADDAENFCNGFDRSSVATHSNAIALVSNTNILRDRGRAWVQPISSTCTAIDADGILHDDIQQSCDEYLSVVCSASLKEPIYGNAYTSYFSDQSVGTYEQDFYKRIVDKDRLPFQLGGTLSFVQADLDNEDTVFVDLNSAIFTVPDSVPVAIGVNVTLAYGDVTNLEIAFDTHNETGTVDYLWTVDDNTTSLPTKIQLHTRADICIKNIDVLIYNETHHNSKIATIPAYLFENCLDYNVCTASDEILCGRSLMYYDEKSRCAKLTVGSSFIPQDLSINLLSSRCSRLTTWAHDQLGSTFLIEVNLASGNDRVEVKELLDGIHQYSFTANASSLLLKESSVLPRNFEIIGDGVLEVFKITRYGKIISNVNFSKMYDCINMCAALGYPSGILFKENNVTSVQVQLLDAVECRKLEMVLTASGDGREKCTAPSNPVYDTASMVLALEAMKFPDSPFRTIKLNLTRNFIGSLVEHPDNEILVPSNRGLILFQDLDVTKDMFAIENIHFVVDGHGELHLNDLNINGTSFINTLHESEATITGCNIHTKNIGGLFLLNAGVTEISSSNLFGDTMLQNIGKGRINHMYVGYFDNSTIVNMSNDTIIQLSQTTLHENFAMNGIDWTNFNKDFLGSLVLPDAKRFYATVDDDSDSRCKGTDVPDQILKNLDENQCRKACEDSFICSGVITYFVSEEPMCGLCLREEQCSFNCPTYDGGAYYVAGSNFDYSKIKACPFITRPFKYIQGVTLKECKMLCSYFRPCEGFRVIPFNTCELIADLDFAEICTPEHKEYIYIPYVNTTRNYFEKVDGVLLKNHQIAVHLGYSLSECSTICRKTMSCVSFQLSDDICSLYNHRDYTHNGQDNGLYLYVDDVFPKKRYMVHTSCYIADAYESHNVKSVERCSNTCDGDYSCAGFVFRPLVTLFDDNCELFNSTALINRVFGPDLGCLEQPQRRTLEESTGNRLDAGEYLVSINGAPGSRTLKHEKKGKSSHPSPSPSMEHSIGPSPSPSDYPSMFPSIIPSGSTIPSLFPSTSPSLTALPSIAPSLSNEPSLLPTVSLLPSQVSQTYDLHIAFVKEIYIESSGRGFIPVQTFFDIDEDECKTLCFYEKNCIALRFDDKQNSCVLGNLVEILHGNSSLNSTYLVLDSQQIDVESRYISTNACLEGEKLENIKFAVEETKSYVKIPRTCSPFSGNELSVIQSTAECGLECSKDEACLGFQYYIEYEGSKNRDKLGTCDLIMSTFDLGICDGVDNNSDLYLRADIGVPCEATCNLHHLCSAFVFDQHRCDLYSDISLSDDCGKLEQVHLGLSYRSRDGLVAAPNQCLIEYEDLQEVGCYDFTSYQSYPVATNSIMTPFLCQKNCEELGKEMYAVKGGNSCICGSLSFLNLSVSENVTASCDLECAGDSSQFCGGTNFASIGYTGLPLFGLTLPQCKRECFGSKQCEALIFDSSGTISTCELRSRGKFETCSTDTQLYIESLEHYYTMPLTSYIGARSILSITADLKQDCQKLCDSFGACESIKYDTVTKINNCQLLGGDIVQMADGDTAHGIEVANDVNLYTKGFSAKGMTLITSVATTFDLDECRTICEQHVQCGSLEYRSPVCNLYDKNDFAIVTYGEDSYESSPFYISYSSFLDPGQEFHSVNNLCIVDSNNFLTKRRTTQSIYDCAEHCDANRECTMFSYDTTISTCILFGRSNSLSTINCKQDKDVSTFIMFTRAKFSPIPDACLKEEISLPSIKFERKNPLECMALCDKWFNCRSFRSDELSGECTLYESEQYRTKECPRSSSGLLFLYTSDQYFTRLDEDFCVGTEPITSIDSTPIEACKTICNYHIDCLSFEHTQSGSCILYSSADFTACEKQYGKDLYISYRDVVDPTSRFFFNELSSCFDVSNDTPIEDINDEEMCKEYCENYDDCSGIQINQNSCFTIGVEKFIETDILPFDQCEKAFLKTKLNPYKKIKNTCLQHHIDFKGARILNKEVYECMKLCDIHPRCRYFIHGEDADISYPDLRECILFEAQGREIDDCEGDYVDFTDLFSGLPAYVNGRTFVDQITWFGEPETVFAKVSGISYQECASLCDSIRSCNAFTHTWNYRRYPLLSRSLLFAKTRIASLDFGKQNHSAKYLAFDTASNRLVLKSAFSDDDVRAQLVSPEVINIDTATTKLKLKFWSSSGQCLSKGATHELFDSGISGDTHTLDTIVDYFEGLVPSCMTVELADCSDGNVLLFDNFLDVGFNEPINFSWQTQDDSGCLRQSRTSEEDLSYTGYGKIPIPVKVNCTTFQEIDVCEMLTSVSSSPSPTYSSSPSFMPSFSSSPSFMPSFSSSPSFMPSFSSSPSFMPSFGSEIIQCQEIDGRICQNLPNGTAEYFNTVITYEQCKNSSKICNDEKCIITTHTNTTECWNVQKQVYDLVNEMYSFFHERCSPNRSSFTNIFSSTYSGVGCKFDDSAVIFQSHQFSFASDSVVMQNDESGKCLHSNLSLGSCSETTEWVYIFSSGHLYYVDSGDMKCLTRDTFSSGIRIEDCDVKDSRQSWLYYSDKGTITAPLDTSICILVDTNSGSIQTGNCDEKSSKWSRYEECRLTTRTATKKMKLESINDQQQCLAIDDDAKAVLKKCIDSTDEWIYSFNSNNATLIHQSGNGTLCLGRKLDDGQYENTCNNLNICKEPQNYPSGLVPCSEVVWSRLVLAGEEQNIFQWSLIDFTSGEKIGPDYCLEVPTQSTQRICTANLNFEQNWRAYGNEGDATEISVKPSASLQIVTDPEVLFQFYLFAKEGKSSRILRSRMAGLIRDVERLQRIVNMLMVIVAEAFSIVDSVQEPIGTVKNRLTQCESKFEFFSNVLIPFEFVPYVGKVIKAARLRPVTGQVSKHMKKGQHVIDQVDSRVQQLKIPIGKFETILQKLNEVLPSVYGIDKFVDHITRSSFCALREGNQEYYDTTQVIVNILITKVNLSTIFITDLKNPLSIINSFKADISKYIKSPIRSINRLLDPLYDVMASLSFLEKIYSLTIPIPHVKIKFGFSCKWYGCWPTISVKYEPVHFNLEMVGKILKKILDAIKSIPIVGEIFDFVEGAVESALGAIFKFIGVELPSFEINLPFIDRFNHLVDEAIELTEDFIDYFNGILDLNVDFPGLTESLVDPIIDAIPSVEIFKDCENSDTPFECIFDLLGINFNLSNIVDPGDLPQVSIDGLEIPSIQDFKEILLYFIDDKDAMNNQINNLVSNGVQCSRYDTVPIEVISVIETYFGIESSRLPIPSCPINMEICTEMNFPFFEEFKSFIKGKLETSLQTRARRLFSVDSICRTNWPGNVPWDFGVKITLPLLKAVSIPFFRYKNSGKYMEFLKGSIFLIDNATFELGCKNAEFQFVIKMAPILKFIPPEWQGNFQPTTFSKNALTYLEDRSGQGDKNHADQSPNLKKFQEEMKMMTILSKILCHINFHYISWIASEINTIQDNDFKGLLDAYIQDYNDEGLQLPYSTIRKILYYPNGNLVDLKMLQSIEEKVSKTDHANEVIRKKINEMGRENFYVQKYPTDKFSNHKSCGHKIPSSFLGPEKYLMEVAKSFEVNLFSFFALKEMIPVRSKSRTFSTYAIGKGEDRLDRKTYLLSMFGNWFLTKLPALVTKLYDAQVSYDKVKNQHPRDSTEFEEAQKLRNVALRDIISSVAPTMNFYEILTWSKENLNKGENEGNVSNIPVDRKASIFDLISEARLTTVPKPRPCEPNPCKQDGVCELSDDGMDYKCTNCGNWKGKNCNIGICDPSPCKNGATCKANEDQTDYECLACGPGYTGKDCTIELCPADRSPCQNGSTCLVKGNDYKCDNCVGYAGKNCDIDPCDQNPCEHGECKALPDGSDYKCINCVGYAGKNCDIDPCDRNPCGIGGNCERNSNGLGYKCEQNIFAETKRYGLDFKMFTLSFTVEGKEQKKGYFWNKLCFHPKICVQNFPFSDDFIEFFESISGRGGGNVPNPTAVPIAMPIVHPMHQPSSHPSGYPSEDSSMYPTLPPSNIPSIHYVIETSGIPTEQLMTQPSGQPVTKAPTSCFDDPSFNFILDNGKSRSCEWLTRNSNPSVIESRITNYCSRGHVKGACQSTCNYCPCRDKSEFEFTLDIGVLRGCDWLLQSSNPLIDARRVDSYCYADAGKTIASDVGDACVLSCGFCSGGGLASITNNEV